MAKKSLFKLKKIWFYARLKSENRVDTPKKILIQFVSFMLVVLFSGSCGADFALMTKGSAL